LYWRKRYGKKPITKIGIFDGRLESFGAESEYNFAFNLLILLYTVFTFPFVSNSELDSSNKSGK
jgi:hypothetical protein